MNRIGQINKILVVDNDELILDFMKEILLKEGYTVMAAQDGLSALDIFETYTPDVAFIDLVMPNIDGKKLIKIIRERPVSRNTYIVIFSAIAVEEELDISELGADACLAKGPLRQMEKNVLATLDRIPSDPSKPAPTPLDDDGGLSHRRISEELLSTKRHLEIILEKMAEGILEITPEDRIVYVNPAFSSFINMQEHELLASSFTELFHEEDRKRINEILQRMNDGSEAITEESPVNLDGHQLTLSILPIEGEKSSFVIIVNDVTDRKRSEEALRSAHNELEKIVEERTLELVRVNKDLKQEIEERKHVEHEREKFIFKLKEALENVKTLRGLLPICCNCKKIRDDEGYWNQIESYIRKHSEAEFTHSLCPNCAHKLYCKI